MKRQLGTAGLGPRRIRILFSLVLAFALIGSSALASPTPPNIPLRQPKNEFRVHTIDVDQGQAILVQTLQGKNILLDAGEDYASPRLTGYLKKIGVKKLDWLVLSHRHMDHMGGVPALAKAFGVDNLVVPWAKTRVPKTAMAFLAPLRRDVSKPLGKSNRPKFHTGITGKSFNFGGGAKGEVLWPPKPTGGLRVGDYNEESLVMRVSQKAPKSKNTASFVVGGDLVWQIERHLAKTMPGKLRADGLVGNHHGSKGSFERTYLEAVAGQSSPLLKQGPNGGSKVSKLAKAVMDLSRRKNGKELANQVGLLLYQANQSQTGALRSTESFAARGAKGTKPRHIDPLARQIADALLKEAKAGNTNLPWITYSAGHNNPYHHPNSQKMALATLLGSTMLGTDVHGHVVMTRKVSKQGTWSGGWQGHTMGDLSMPKVADKMPFYKRKKDPKNPYNDVAREANYVFSTEHPDPTVSWEKKETFMAAPGKTQNGVFMKMAREARKGRAAFVRDWRALRASGDKKADAKLAQAKAKPWHGQKIEGDPWDQNGNTIWANQNSRLRQRYTLRRQFTARRLFVRPARRVVKRRASLSLLGSRLTARRNKVQGVRGSLLSQAKLTRGLETGKRLHARQNSRMARQTGQLRGGSRMLLRPARWGRPMFRRASAR